MPGQSQDSNIEGNSRIHGTKEEQALSTYERLIVETNHLYLVTRQSIEAARIFLVDAQGKNPTNPIPMYRMSPRSRQRIRLLFSSISKQATRTASSLVLGDGTLLPECTDRWNVRLEPLLLCTICPRG